MNRFEEDERPIPEMAAEFAVVLDGVEDLQAGPYTFNITNLIRLHCRIGRIRVHIEEIEVGDWKSTTGPGWQTANGSDHMACLITDLIRARYDTQDMQAWLRTTAARQEPEEDEDERGGD